MHAEEPACGSVSCDNIAGEMCCHLRVEIAIHADVVVARLHAAKQCGFVALNVCLLFLPNQLRKMTAAEAAH
jgi:hypothetical protein